MTKIIPHSIISEFIPEEKTRKVAIAVSGGADSMCLSLLSKEHGKNFIALIVDHGLREEASKEAGQTKDFLEAKGIEAKILKWEGQKPESNIQESARDARYKLLTDYCNENSIDTLLVAHTKNDQAETVFLRMLRGSGVDGMCGMSQTKILNGVNIVRPMLGHSRDEVIATLEKNSWSWVEDPSNQDEKYDRVKVRNLINAQDDKEIWIDRLNLLASNMQRTKSFLENEVETALNSMVELDKSGSATLNPETFQKLDEEIALRLLAKVLKKIGEKQKPPRLEKLKLLYQKLHQEDYKGSTLWGCKITPNKFSIIFTKETTDK